MIKFEIKPNYENVSKTLRIPKNIVDEIQALATENNYSFNQVVTMILEWALKPEDETSEKSNSVTQKISSNKKSK